MADILVPTFGTALIEGGVANLEMHDWMELVSGAVNDLRPLTGTGTPEAAVVASPGRWFVDTAAAPGTGIYFKETGDGDTGWILRS